MCLLLAFKSNKLAAYDNKMQKINIQAEGKMKSVYRNIYTYYQLPTTL